MTYGDKKCQPGRASIIGVIAFIIIISSAIGVIIWACTGSSKPSQNLRDITGNSGEVTLNSEQENQFTLLDFSTEENSETGHHGNHCWGVISGLSTIVMVGGVAFAI